MGEKGPQARDVQMLGAAGFMAKQMMGMWGGKGYGYKGMGPGGKGMMKPTQALAAP